MEFRDVVRHRRMIRRFEPRPIPRPVLERVLEVARHAPSAGFSQGFDFIVLDQPAQLESFYRLTDDPRDPEFFPGREREVAPASLVLPFSNKRFYLERYSQPDKAAFDLGREENWPVPFWDVDTGMAIMLILLAAVDEGLGAWYFGLTRGEADLRRELGVPDEARMMGVIALGYPSAADQPRGSSFSLRRRPFTDLFHFGHW